MGDMADHVNNNPRDKMGPDPEQREPFNLSYQLLNIARAVKFGGTVDGANPAEELTRAAARIRALSGMGRT